MCKDLFRDFNLFVLVVDGIGRHYGGFRRSMPQHLCDYTKNAFILLREAAWLLRHCDSHRHHRDKECHQYNCHACDADVKSHLAVCLCQCVLPNSLQYDFKLSKVCRSRCSKLMILYIQLSSLRERHSTRTVRLRLACCIKEHSYTYTVTPPHPHPVRSHSSLSESHITTGCT